MRRFSLHPRSTPAMELPTGLIKAMSLVICLLGAGEIHAESKAPTPQASVPDDSTRVFTEETSVTWVLVPISVEEAGRDVTQMRREDFELLIDGRPIPFPDFVTPRDVPRTLLVFQDLSGSMANGGKLEASRRGVRYFLEQAREGDEMALTTFASGKTFVDVPITDERSAILEYLDSWRAYGTTALHDSIAWIPQLRLGARTAPAVLLVTDGVDNASVISPEKARAMVRASEVPVYVIALRRPRQIDRKSSNEDGAWLYRDLLRRLATETGGLYVETQPDDILSACRHIHRALESRYSLAFPLGQGEPSFHQIQVKVDARRFTLRHRSGYVGSPPAEIEAP